MVMSEIIILAPVITGVSVVKLRDFVVLFSFKFKMGQNVVTSKYF